MSSDEFPQGLSKMNARPQTTEPTKRPAESVSLEEYLPHRLSVVSRLVTALLQKCYADSFGLTIAEWKILTIVGHGSPISPTAVGRLADMDKVQVSRSSASLMDRGFLSQNPDPSDGRGRLLKLTRKGTTLYKNSIPVARGFEAMVAEGLSRTEWAALKKTLTKLEAHLRTIEGT